MKQALERKQSLILIDKIIEKDDQTITAISNFTMSQNFFQGHFPDNPVVPGVLIIEAMSQSCQLLLNNPIRLSQISKVRFREMVRPGDQLKIVAKLKEGSSNAFKLKAYNQDKLACSAELLF